MNTDKKKSYTEEQKEQYRKESAYYFMTNFQRENYARMNTSSISTGFTQLDAVLDGGLYEGLYILGAISSLGKTTFLLQIADQIAASGQDVIIFSLEMSISELIAKSLSRETAKTGIKDNKLSFAKAVRDITDLKRHAKFSEYEKGLIITAEDSYMGYAKNLRIVEGVGDIGVKDLRNAVEKHISITGKPPVIIVDYLQLLAPDNLKGTDKQNVDKSVMELKRLSRDFKIPVLVISSFNRANYSDEVSMSAFKESGAIEYSSDVLIGLQFQCMSVKKNDMVVVNIDEEKRRDPRKIELVILKQRNAETGGRIKYQYYPKVNLFIEKP